MKRLYIILGMLLCSLAMAAQDNWTIDSDSLPTGVYLEDGSLRVNLTEFLSVPEQKAAFLTALNEGYKNRGIETNITDFFSPEEQLPDTVKAVRARARAQRRANALPLVGAKSYKINFDYKSVDYMNQPITLSGVMYLPAAQQENFRWDSYAGDAKSWWGFGLLALPSIWAQIAKLVLATIVDQIIDIAQNQVEWGMLSVHPTVTSNDEAPTGTKAPELSAVKAMPSERCLVVCPDYCGYGYTKNMQHPYLIQDITARNCIDGYLAAIKLAKKQASFSDDFYTHIVGYSQGGSVALACTKYVQSGLLTDEEKNTINLQATFCGDGPYSPVETISQYMTWANDKDQKYNRLAYPCVLPLICAAAKQYYDKGCMRTVKVEDYFTKEFLATNIIKDLESKVVTTEQLNEKTKAANIYNIDQMMSDKMVYHDKSRSDSLFFNTKSNEYKCLMRAMDKADLTKGWVPEKPVYFLHFDGDLVVPYANVLPVKKNMENEWKDKAFFIDAKDALDWLPRIWYLAAMYEGVADKNEWDHVKVGTLFYVWYMSGCPSSSEHDDYWRTVEW